MKTLILLLCSCMFATFSYAQNTQDDYAAAMAGMELPSRSFITLGGGINANFGLVGIGAELPLGKQVSTELGFGTSTWGFKLHDEIKYYFKPGYEGWSVGFGLGYYSGLSKFVTTLETEPDQESEEVTLDLKPVTALNFSMHHAWRIGKAKRHKIFIQSGYVFRLTDPYYTVTSDHKLSVGSKTILNIIAPGGFTMALGFNIGL